VKTEIGNLVEQLEKQGKTADQIQRIVNLHLTRQPANSKRELAAVLKTE
jgi:hypothetical protein